MYRQIVGEKNSTSDNEQIFSSPNYSGSMIVKITTTDDNALEFK